MASLDNDPRITIDGVEGVWILMNDVGKDGENGAVTTQELFNNFEISYAHMNDGTIKRFKEIIATHEQWHYVVEQGVKP